MKNKFRSYGFWTALAGAVVVLVNALGSAFGFTADNQMITDIIMAVAGVLVVFGVVVMPKKEEQEKPDILEDDEEDKNKSDEENKPDV